MILEVLKFPDARLRETAEPILESELDDSLRALVQSMIETMYDEPGIGLAATQIGVAKRLVVMDVNYDEDQGRDPRVLINPEIVLAEGKIISPEEGCLSVPDFNADVQRSQRIVVRARDLDWKEVEYEGTELEAFCYQHEVDHLDGVLFIDHISKLKRDLYIRRRKKQLRREQEEDASSLPTY